MINSKVTKTPNSTDEEKLFKVLESMDWKLWEIMNMMKDNLPEKPKAAKTPKIAPKKEADSE